MPITGLAVGLGIPPQRPRLGFLGRVSSGELQDPSISLPRQVKAGQKVADELGGDITFLAWDIESGRKDLINRGNGDTPEEFGVPLRRDGGLAELLVKARARELDAVVVESIDRLSRRTSVSTGLEDELKALGIPILASDEPLEQNATALLLRRTKQAVAEWYVADILEKSRKGAEQSVLQGWHSGGRPPYGYALEEHPHPNPNRAKEGKKKHRLVLDTVRGPVVKLIYRWYCEEGIGLTAICDRLNANPALYPAPDRNKKDDHGLPASWGRSVVHAILRNPKYTGYNVWNRHEKRRGIPTAKRPDEWVWSDEPTHEALISIETFQSVAQRAARNTKAFEEGAARPRTGTQGRRSPKRLYPLSGRVICAICERRMIGACQKNVKCYRCQFSPHHGRVAATRLGHPKSIQIPEPQMLQIALEVLSRRVFGPDRIHLLEEELGRRTSDDASESATRLAAARREHDEIDLKLRRQVRAFEDTDDEMTSGLIADRIKELAAQRERVAQRLKDMEAERARTEPTGDPIAILQSIPDLSQVLATYGDADLAELFDAFDLVLHVDKPAGTARVTITLAEDLADLLEGASRTRLSIAGAGFEPATFGL